MVGEHIAAHVIFNDKSHCDIVYSYFNDLHKKIECPTKNSKGEVIEINYGYDIRDLPDSKWVAVVMRNLPGYATKEIVQNLCESAVNNATNYVASVGVIRDTCCAVVVVNDIEIAEKLCIVLHKKQIEGGYVLKVNVHPQSDKRTRNYEKSHFSKFFKKRKANTNHSQNKSNANSKLIK